MTHPTGTTNEGRRTLLRAERRPTVEPPITVRETHRFCAPFSREIKGFLPTCPSVQPFESGQWATAVPVCAIRSKEGRGGTCNVLVSCEAAPRHQASALPLQHAWSCVRSPGVCEVVSLASQGLPIEAYGETV